jgi:hypothetical protein
MTGMEKAINDAPHFHRGHRIDRLDSAPSAPADEQQSRTGVAHGSSGPHQRWLKPQTCCSRGFIVGTAAIGKMS